MSQELELTSEFGWVVGVGIPIAVARRVSINPSVDLVRTRVTATLLACAPVAPTGQCLSRPGRETVAYANALVRLSLVPSGGVRPFLEGGLALGHSFVANALGARQNFVAPRVGAGLVIPTPAGSWSVSGTWRRLNRWSPTLRPGDQAMLMFGYRPW